MNMSTRVVGCRSRDRTRGTAIKEQLQVASLTNIERWEDAKDYIKMSTAGSKTIQKALKVVESLNRNRLLAHCLVGSRRPFTENIKSDVHMFFLQQFFTIKSTTYSHYLASTTIISTQGCRYLRTCVSGLRQHGKRGIASPRLARQMESSWILT